MIPITEAKSSSQVGSFLVQTVLSNGIFRLRVVDVKTGHELLMWTAP